MSLIVQKFGGTSVASIDRIKHVAKRIISERSQSNDVVVVVSAMAGVTNQLINWVHQSVDSLPDSAEYDVVVSSGEQVTSGLLSLVLSGLGQDARSFLGWQLPIRTDAVYRKAQIQDIETTAIRQCLSEGNIPIVSGFQGVCDEGRITTLGRGGSDLTAIALAAVLKADRCDIYTDVDGVYSADPRVVPQAHRLDYVHCDEMLEMAWQGAKVLQPESVAWGKRQGVPVWVRSSFHDGGGTCVSFKPSSAATSGVTGIASNRNIAVFDGAQDLDKPALKSLLKTQHIHVEFVEDSNKFIVLSEDVMQAEALVAFEGMKIDRERSMVSIVGTDVGLYKDLLADYPGQFIESCDLRLGKIIPKSQEEDMVRCLHKQFISQKTDSTTERKVA
ncbi:MAG: aspartate kinase [Alphaproteobacteria bacterium]